MKRLTIRLRLTLVYLGLVLTAGVLLLGVTYLLVDARTTQAGTFTVADYSPTDQATPSAGSSQIVVQTDSGQHIPATDLPAYVRDSLLRSLLTQGGIALLAVTVIAGVIAWLLAGRALQPLHRITETAQRIGGVADGTGRGLHERIGLTGPHDEVRRLADTFDGMLERLDRSFEGQRRFVANASHELRTPLAINRALIEVAITRADASADACRLGDALLVVNGRHERLILGLLTLADSENQLAERHLVDLADVARHIVETAGSPASDSQVTVRAPRLAPAPTGGDPVLLERLVQNLVDNAIRHNVPGGWVTVETDHQRDTATLIVSNTGPVVPRYEVESLFQPFRRLNGERTDRDRGFGLGLSIVRAVTRTHNGSVTVTPREASEGGGLTVRVNLPAQPHTAAAGHLP